MNLKNHTLKGLLLQHYMSGKQQNIPESIEIEQEIESRFNGVMKEIKSLLDQNTVEHDQFVEILKKNYNLLGTIKMQNEIIGGLTVANKELTDAMSRWKDTPK